MTARAAVSPLHVLVRVWVAMLGALLACVPLVVAVTDWRGQSRAAAADAAQRRGDFDAALALRRQATLVSPRDAALQLSYATAARSLWFFRDTPALQHAADVAYTRAAQLSPHWAAVPFEHARMYAFKERYGRAVALLDPALTLDPANAGLWLERAGYLEQLSRFAEARAAYERCWAIDVVWPCDAGLRRVRGRS
ncbi:tetratricopeptide (TPR) repeat protein [Deinococcus metalli]|uniref:Tetratricopeptide (TPR) repeat protein n=1 Tax=Deinococcus metalli TaxID=1141878 RepID=A0A7W8NRZ7_9DEIO|nr:hypothetical protein [Deinococcus metalli]MBB5376642.1 tetratricopeptide (TPR) repeat protein [Deinococcus metalli]GHF42569.1 hypothetical protein GCM10017781_18600 [Deinococcus metalli]